MKEFLKLFRDVEYFESKMYIEARINSLKAQLQNAYDDLHREYPESKLPEKDSQPSPEDKKYPSVNTSTSENVKAIGIKHSKEFEKILDSYSQPEDKPASDPLKEQESKWPESKFQILRNDIKALQEENKRLRTTPVTEEYGALLATGELYESIKYILENHFIKNLDPDIIFEIIRLFYPLPHSGGDYGNMDEQQYRELSSKEKEEYRASLQPPTNQGEAGGEEKSGEYVEMENGLCHFVESSSPNKRGTVYYMGRIKSLENEILSLKQQLKEKQGWSDEDMENAFQHGMDYHDDNSGDGSGYRVKDFNSWLTEYKSKTNR